MIVLSTSDERMYDVTETAAPTTNKNETATPSAPPTYQDVGPSYSETQTPSGKEIQPDCDGGVMYLPTADMKEPGETQTASTTIEIQPAQDNNVAYPRLDNEAQPPQDVINTV